MTASSQSATGSREAWFYLLGGLSGVGIGWVDLTVNDLLFTALLVLAAGMLLGILRPWRPWRWVIAIVIFIPLTEFVAYRVTHIQPTNGQIFGSFLTALPCLAGAYGGAVVRNVADNLRHKK